MKKILVVEDEKDYAALVAKKLEEGGYDIKTINTGSDALEYLRDHKPDLIILDIMLPDIDGLSILNEIAANKKFSGVPVFILSNLDEPGSFEQARAIGDYEYMVKVHTDLGEILKKVNQKLQ